MSSSSSPRLAPATRGGLSALLLLAAPPVLGADNDYLREIEEEARRQATVLITSPLQPSSTAPTAPPDAKADRFQAGLNPAAFEQALRQQLPDAYTIYQQLDAHRKQQVYQAYQNDNQFASISQRIAQLRGGKP